VTGRRADTARRKRTPATALARLRSVGQPSDRLPRSGTAGRTVTLASARGRPGPATTPHRTPPSTPWGGPADAAPPGRTPNVPRSPTGRRDPPAGGLRPRNRRPVVDGSGELTTSGWQAARPDQPNTRDRETAPVAVPQPPGPTRAVGARGRA